eukprot:TRINITY_DN4355_c0_g1_i6.p1 TRINITY_DN4355_c0_g1~~TRINITY_DN4355_c0_g1_i6.p1  ORF type:complete len:403 (-),score=107.71 TRINITY_DN4355_c0_g1_i6:420-1601(-)
MSRMYQESVYEGYLNKSPPKMNRKWQRRYFVLLPYQKLLYFSKYNGEQKGIIDLDQVQEVLLDVYICKAQSNIISVEVKGSGEETGKISAPDRTYYLLADSREEMETWHKNICEVAGLQLCRKNNVVADYTQGDENYMSARRKTALDREEVDKRGLAYSFNPDSGQSSDYGTYNKDSEFSQSAQTGDSYGLYSSNQSVKELELDSIAISLGEDSQSDEEGFTSPDFCPVSSRPLMKSPIPVTPNKNSRPIKQHSVLSVASLPIQTLSIYPEDDSPELPPHRQEQLYPEKLNFNLPVPPRRMSSQKRFSLPRYPAPSPEDKPRPKERKSVTSRESRNVTQYTTMKEVLKEPPSPIKRAAAKTPSVPVSVILTTVKDITPEPQAKPRRPASSMVS